MGWADRQRIQEDGVTAFVGLPYAESHELHDAHKPHPC